MFPLNRVIGPAIREAERIQRLGICTFVKTKRKERSCCRSRRGKLRIQRFGNLISRVRQMRAGLTICSPRRSGADRRAQISQLEANQATVVVGYRRSSVQLSCEQIDIATLQIAPVGIDMYRPRTRIDLLPDAFANITEKICGSISSGAINRFLLDQT